MKRLLIACSALFAASAVSADNLTGLTEIVCSTATAQICFETGECLATPPSELNIPDFVVIDTNKKTIRTTKANAQNRSTAFTRVERDDQSIMLQGVDVGAFSLVIDIVTGRFSGAIARDGMSVSVFGACTSTKL